MDPEEVNNDVVHPEVRAHINSLVSALGGASADDDGRYKLGDDALEVLRDLKKWIRFYDEKTNRMDVARCLAEANLIGNDLLPILSLWPQSESESRYKSRIALACFEVMVPLTWPIDQDPEKMTKNHHRHLPVLQLAQLNYKKAIINYDGAQILHTAIRAALPSMAVPISDRTARDQAIIKLTLFFLRNIAMINPPPGVTFDGEESLISRSAVIDAFSFQDVFLLLLTIASNMGEDFRTEDVTLMEIIFHLVKRVDSSKLFLNEKQLNKAKNNELGDLLRKEKEMLKQYKNNTSSRHNRFGSMIWVKREDGKMMAVSGQDAVINASAREAKIESSKKFRPPRKSRKFEMEPKDLGPPVSLNARANGQLRSFVADFLDSGFNPLFQHVRKSIDREAPHVLSEHRPMFFYLVAWFLEAERNRRKSEKEAGKVRIAEDIRSFNLVAGVLNQEMFITLQRYLNQSWSDKNWQELTMVMKCFTQILLTVQEMWESGNEDDEEIADNILSRLFYEESTHDAVASIARTYKDQGFEYLDACTEFIHTYLRTLEAYSKQNVDLQVRSRKRARRKKKAAKTGGDAAEEESRDQGDESADDEANAERVSKERNFNFKQFAMRFISQGVVDTFVKFTQFYQDLDDSELKRAHRYFYRVAFKLEMSVMLFRIDIINLFNNMIRSPDRISRSSSMYKEWEELAKQIIRKCIRKLEERPALFVELLFSKIQSTAHYLEFGFEKQTVSSSNSRPAAELEFRHVVDRDQQIAITVGVLLDKGQGEHHSWLKLQLAEAKKKREEERSEPDFDGEKGFAPIAVHPDTPERKTAMFKNPHLRLLMKLVGMELLAPTLDETPDSTWVFKSDVTPEALEESSQAISKAEFAPPTFEDGKAAADQLKRKPAARKPVDRDEQDDVLAGFLDEDDDLGSNADDDDVGALFAPGGPTPRTADGPKKKKTLRRRRRGDEDKPEPTAEELDEKARARREREREKASKIKSQMYVDPDDDLSDDERDAEFFEREKKRQEAKNATFGLSAKILEDEDGDSFEIITKPGVEDEVVPDAWKSKGPEKTKTKAKPTKASRKRKSDAVLQGISDDDEDEDSDEAPKRQSRKKRKPAVKALAESSDEDAGMGVNSSATLVDISDEMDTDDGSSPASPEAAEAVTGTNPEVLQGGDDEDEDGLPVKVAPKAKPRARLGFIIDSSDEE